MMDNIILDGGNLDADLEKGEVSGELGSNGRLILGAIRMNQLCSETVSDGIGSCKGSVKSNCSDGLENMNLMVVIDKKADVLEKKIVKEKPKAMSAKKPPKPPRPPRGLSLDLADQKLIRELHELAKLKRARTERMKALKKAKEAKVASSKNQLFATLLTVLFCIVFLFQGISSRTNSAVNFQGSPISSGVTEDSVISIQKYPTSYAIKVNGPGFDSPRLVGPVSCFDTQEQVSSAVG